MDKKSTPEDSLLQELKHFQNQGELPEKYCRILTHLVLDYQSALKQAGQSFESALPLFRMFFQFVIQQLRSPYSFEPYHRKIRRPIDYYQFGLDFIRPLVDLSHSKVYGLEQVERIAALLAQKENVIFFANHQTESDPQAISLLIQKTDPTLAESIIYVAGERVVTDPLAVPFSLGCDLLCIYSKRYIDFPPEQKAAKQIHNKNTMELMSRLLQEGGKAIYVAPSGGRDRKNESNQIIPALFDPNSIEMFYLMAKKAKTPTHFFPLALDTYDLLPPPETIQVELGEARTLKRTAIHIAFGPECDMDKKEGGTKEEMRKNRANAIWNTVLKLYQTMKKP